MGKYVKYWIYILEYEWKYLYFVINNNLYFWFSVILYIDVGCLVVKRGKI